MTSFFSIALQLSVRIHQCLRCWCSEVISILDCCSTCPFLINKMTSFLLSLDCFYVFPFMINNVTLFYFVLDCFNVFPFIISTEYVRFLYSLARPFLHFAFWNSSAMSAFVLALISSRFETIHDYDSCTTLKTRTWNSGKGKGFF
jgi:hypothetical protein